MSDCHWTDAHCHLQEFLSDGSLDRLLDRAALFSVSTFHVNGTRPEDWEAVSRLAERPEIRLHFGLHPWFAEREDDWGVQLRARLLRFPKAGIGEIGLDRRLTDTPYPVQVEVLHEQLALGRELGRTCTLHAVGPVFEDLYLAVREHRPPAVLLHAWGGGTRRLADWIACNAYFSVGGALCREPRSGKLEQTLRAIPPDRLLLESDAPWQHPDGAAFRTEPALLLRIAETAASILGTPIDRLRAQCALNALNCFGA